MKKIILSSVLLILVCCFSFGQDINDFVYDTKNGAVTITKYKGSVTDVVVPERINGLPVTAIGRMAFMNCKITSIVLPNSIHSIGLAAFANNQLTTLAIPASLESIGAHAFGINQLTVVTIPASVTSIGLFAFDGKVEIIRQ